jgi:hydrogenase expression/formation protein HypE
MQLGKPSRELMAGLIGRLTGSKAASVIIGPTPGVDVSILQVEPHKVMIVSCDPVSFIPSMGARDSARMSVYEVASDVATSGISPKYAVVDLNLPPKMSDRVLTAYWKSFHNTCKELGLSIIGGHTGRFEGCDYSVIGGATLWTYSSDDGYVTSNMAKDGDDIVITKSAAFGATSVLTRAFPRTVRRTLGHKLFDKAWNYFRSANTVRDATTAVKAGIHDRGVTAMHDSTEVGVVAAILELAEASHLGGTISLDDIPISEETLQLCRHFRINPLTSLGEGSLVIACRPQRTKAIIDKLRQEKIRASRIGILSSSTRGVYGTNNRGRISLRYPSKDPYWRAYWKAVRNGWS